MRLEVDNDFTNKSIQKCYMCENIATSQEHVPPKCLFPEQKDTRGIDFRKNLIKIPSCDIHNMSKSDDDEFLMLSLSGIITNNIIGQFHFLTKSNRAIQRKSKDFISKQILKNLKVVDLKISEKQFKPAAIGHPNIERLNSCFEHIAYGLYYHEYNTRFEGEIKIFYGFLEYTDQYFQTLKKFIKKRFDIDDELKLPKKGDNNLVFNYEFQKPDNFGLFSVKLVFYGTTEIFISFKPENVKEPVDLAMMLMKNGIKTIINLDNERFEFN
ncbi:hypothetical protein [Flavobacterium sp. ov086]|uniref:hypothetical protein n=1 Tax=Flavobacterium sp. ov086 TaxID=1761785 RepID=UPI000B726CC7|nr:hypothetical protein [Flavobacterium sp. ov086]SNR53937.1 hypothetical protein SAMN04487979_11094 [Flavobacterium sp. ov086]